MILQGRLHEPSRGLLEVRGAAVAGLIPEAKPVGALGVSVSRGPAVPLHSLGKILRHAEPALIEAAKAPLGAGRAVRRGPLVEPHRPFKIRYGAEPVLVHIAKGELSVSVPLVRRGIEPLQGLRVILLKHVAALVPESCPVCGLCVALLRGTEIILSGLQHVSPCRRGLFLQRAMLLKVHAAKAHELRDLLPLHALSTGFVCHLLQRIVCLHSRCPPFRIGGAVGFCPSRASAGLSCRGREIQQPAPGAPDRLSLRAPVHLHPRPCPVHFYAYDLIRFIPWASPHSPVPHAEYLQPACRKV